MSFTVVGTTDETLSCDCCGRTGLKMTVVLRDSEGEFVFYGRTCAPRATRWRAAYLEREVLAAQARVAQARDMVTRWSRYVRPDGTADTSLFLSTNPGPIGRPQTTATEAEAMIYRVIADNTRTIDSLRRDAA